jgi:NADPH-dependent glutamate synthase beta subunit-like oxidoreductase
MNEDSKKDVAKDVYCRLGNKIDGQDPDAENGRKREDTWIQILVEIITERQAEVSIMCKQTFETAQEIADNNGVRPEDIIDDLYAAAERGILTLIERNGVDMFRLSNWYPGIVEHFLLNRDVDEKKLAALFKYEAPQFSPLSFQNVPTGGGVLRAIPVGQAIEAESNTATYEQIQHYLDQSDYYAVADCVCRKASYLLDKACEHRWQDTCVQIGEEAEYYVRTGRGRRLSRQEVEDLLLKFEREGLVHQVFGNEGEGKSSYICNCCSCGGCLGVSVRARLPHANKSNYVAEIDPEKCTACGACVETCNTNALVLGNSFCDREVQIPKMTKHPDTDIWTEDDMNTDWIKRVMVNDYGTSPCKTKCPAHISVQGYIGKASEGKYDDALKVIKRDNPFPAVCGRICPRSCEEECGRAKIDESVAIDDIKKFIADRELSSENRFIPTVYEHYDEKIAIIGAGPAGLSCAYYLAAEGYSVTVFEKQQLLGGMLTMGIPAFRLEKDVVNAEIEVLRELGVEFQTGVDVGKDITISGLRKLGYKAFYIAIGAQGSRKLDVEGENLDGVISGVDFLRDVALEKAEKLSGKTVVIGGGNVAIDVARSAVRLGAGSVSMYCLENSAEMPALDEEKEEALGEGVGINNSWGPKRILGENGKVAGVEFMRCVSVFDENGRFAPKYDENDIITVDCSTVLVSIGQAIEWGNLLRGNDARLTKRGTLDVAEISYQSGERDIFGGGDAVTGPKFAIDAIATGKSGAISIHRFVRKRGMTVRREREYKSFDKDHADYSGFDSLPRQRPLSVDHLSAKATFRDLRKGLTEDQIRKEAKRCLGCGVTVVDEWMCIGCGICTSRCEFDAIHLKRVTDIAPAKDMHSFNVGIMQYAMERGKRLSGS